MNAILPPERSPFVLVSERAAGHELLELLVHQIRSVGRPWSLYTEAEQRDAIAKLDEAVRAAVAQLVLAIAGEGRESVKASVDSVTFKKNVTAKLTLQRGGPASELADRAGSDVTLVLADPREYMEGMDQVRPDKGQLPLVGEGDGATL